MRLFQKRPAFGLKDLVKQIALPNVGTIQSTESLTRIRGRGQRDLPSALAGNEFSPPLHGPGPQDFRPRLESIPSALWLSGLGRTELLALLDLQLAERNS